MIVLALRTDNPTAELYVYDGTECIANKKWEAHRELSVTIHHTIEELLASQKLTLKQLQGIVFFEGPGSFTGLRIGISVVNALGAGLNIPVIGAHSTNWQAEGITALAKLKDFSSIAPLYGSDAFITQPKK